MNHSLLLLDAFAVHPGHPVSRALSGVLESAAAGCPEPSCAGCDQFANCHGAEIRVAEPAVAAVLPLGKAV